MGLDPRVGRKNTAETKRQMSESRLTGLANGTIIPASGYKGRAGSCTLKPVRQLTLDGVYIDTFPSATAAARMTGVAQATISRACNGQVKAPKKWRWEFIDHRPSMGKGAHQNRRIDMLTLDGEYVRSFNSLTAAARAMNLTKSAICVAARSYRTSRSAGGWVWRYAAD